MAGVTTEACEKCRIVVGCLGTCPETHKICDHGFLPPDGIQLCLQNPGMCAVAGEQTIYVPPEQYLHTCQSTKLRGIDARK